MKKKILASCLAACLVCSLAACAGGGKSSSTASPAESTAASTADSSEAAESTEPSETASGDDVMSPYGAYPETVVLSTAKRASAQPNFVEGEDVQNNAMTKYIKDKVNVEIKVDWEVEATEFANKLALMIAADTLPDMFTLGQNDYLVYKQLEENDLLEDLTAAYEACANEYVKSTLGPDSTYGGRNLEPFRTDDGKLLAFAGGRYGYENNLLWARQDWLDASGLSAPSSLEDIENILKTWKDNPPSDEYVGMLLHDKNVGGVYDSNSASPIFASFGSKPNAWVKDSNGDVVWGSVAAETKQGLEVLARWYKEGLIDQQFATRTQGGVRDAMFVAGQTGLAFAPWWYVYSIGDFPAQNPDGLAQPYNAPLNADGKYEIMFPGAAGDYLMVRKGYEHPEAIFKVINCEFDMWRQFDPEGAELITPNRANNVDWGYMFPTSGFNIEPADVIPLVGILARELIEDGEIKTDPNVPSNVWMAENAADYAKTKTLNGTNWIDYTGRYIASNVVAAPEVVVTHPEYYFVTESMADLKPNLDTLEQTTFLKIVTGELPIDAFDQFVTDWYAQGGDKMTEEVRAMVG